MTVCSFWGGAGGCSTCATGTLSPNGPNGPRESSRASRRVAWAPTRRIGVLGARPPGDFRGCEDAGCEAANFDAESIAELSRDQLQREYD